MEKPKTYQPEITPTRFRLSLKAARLLVAGRLRVSGLDNLEQISPTTKLIIATSHLTDEDIPIASSVLSKKLNLVVTDMSQNHLESNPGDKRRMRLAGEHNLISFDYTRSSNGEKHAGIFNIRNFYPIFQALDEGKRVVIAAHKPSFDRKFPTKAGRAAPYAAAISGALILPVAVKYKNPDPRIGITEYLVRTILTHSPVSVNIGAPYQLVEAPPLFEELRQADPSLGLLDITTSNQIDIREMRDYLDDQGQVIMTSIKELLNSIE